MSAGAARPEPEVIEEERVGLYVFVTVRTPWPVPVEDSPQEAHLLTWAEDNVLPWEDYYALNEERDEWQFRVEYGPENYYDG